MSKPKPSCAKCGGAHWGFVRCAEAPARAKYEAENARRRAPHVVRAERSDGLSDWNDRLHTVERNNNVFLNKRTVPIERGSLTGPEGWTPPEAA